MAAPYDDSMAASCAAASWQRRSHAAAEPESPDAHGLGLTHARILLVDDDARNISLLRRVLEHAGFSRLADTTDPLQAAAVCERSPVADALREIERQAGVLFDPFLAKEFMHLPHPELI